MLLVAVLLVSAVPALAQEYPPSEYVNDEMSLYPRCSPFGSISECSPYPLEVPGTGDTPMTPPDPNDPYRIFISDDQAVYCGTGTLGDPITEFCIHNGIVPPVLYDQNGNLISGYGAGPGQYSTEPLPGYVSWDEYCWYDPDDAYVIEPDSNIPTVVTPCGSYN